MLRAVARFHADAAVTGATKDATATHQAALERQRMTRLQEMFDGTEAGALMIHLLQHPDDTGSVLGTLKDSREKEQALRLSAARPRPPALPGHTGPGPGKQPHQRLRRPAAARPPLRPGRGRHAHADRSPWCRSRRGRRSAFRRGSPRQRHRRGRPGQRRPGPVPAGKAWPGTARPGFLRAGTAWAGWRGRPAGGQGLRGGRRSGQRPGQAAGSRRGPAASRTRPPARRAG